MTRARRWLAAAAGAAMIGSLGLSSVAGADGFTSQRIALGGDGVFPNYRIPSVVQLENGDLLASYDGRPTGGDAPGPNWILQRRSTDGGATWGPQEVIAEGTPGAEKLGYSDPSYVVDRVGGTLFNFHVFSKDTGFWNSEYGNDDADRKVMSAVVSVSPDNGETWEERSVTEIVKPDNVRATFATSGHGIQITRGAYAGRLVQQYAGAMDNGTVAAYSLYSDDGGDTWQRGGFVGTNMDENKVVELSDGRLMLNSRMHRDGGARYVTYSSDGGQSWSEPELDYTLTDPRNNASIISMNPGAPAGTREAKELLFSNSNSASSRSNGSVRYSCDDGTTWPVVKVYEPGAHSYSDLVALQDGTFGVFYEGENSELRYGAFDREWLKPFCAHFDTATANANAGESKVISAVVRNDEDVALPAGTATLTLFPRGWTADTVEVPALAPGEEVTIEIPFTASAAAQPGIVRGDVTVTAGDIIIRGDAEITIDEGAEPTMDAEITGKVGEDRDLAENPYASGDKIPFVFSVASTGNVDQTVTPTEGDFENLLPPNAPNCRWRGLKAGADYDCTTPFHTVTDEDMANGFFRSDTTWELTRDGMETVTLTATEGEVDLIVRDPQLSLTREVASIDEDADGYHKAGGAITYDTAATNTGNVRLTELSGDVLADELLAGDTLTVRDTYVITDEDIERGYAILPAAAVAGNNGELAVAADTEDIKVELNVKEPAVDPTEDPAEEPTVDPTVDPTDPADPGTPTNPADPTDPADPGKPSAPSSPGADKPAGGAGPSMPLTGASVISLVLASLGLVGLGVGLVMRRRQA
ncbi:MAG: exo-alpha-sialidase [Flaviflexus sp.]|nr:exo-alpha-sialidase [Flaviflexus sp.]